MPQKTINWNVGHSALVWGRNWKFRLTPAARSKVLREWQYTGKKPKAETSREYTRRRVVEATKPTTTDKILNKTADALHTVGTVGTTAGTLGLLALAPVATVGALAGGTAGSKLTDKIVQGFTGDKLSSWAREFNRKLGLRDNSMIGELTNPGMWIGGGLGAKMAPTVAGWYKPTRTVDLSNNIDLSHITLESPLMESNDITNNLLKWLGRNSNSKVVKPINKRILKPEEQKMIEEWEKARVDLSKFSNHDVERAVLLRKNEIAKSALNNGINRYTLALSYPQGRQRLYDMQNGEKVGFTSVRDEDDGRAHVIITENLTENVDKGIPATVHKVYERGLNSAIQAALSDHLSGVVSGEELLAAPQQYHVLQKFKSRMKLNNNGIHGNESLVLSRGREENKDFKLGTLKQATSILDLKKAGNTVYKIFDNGPVYQLSAPTFHVPTKSTAFNPSIIDSSGKMHIDWSNPNIYKVLFPAIGLGTFGSIKNN